MFGWIQSFLAVRGLAPHGYCLLWEPGLIWSHVTADAVISLSYFSIPFLLLRLLAMRRDIQFSWMLSAFAVFILACGMTHVMAIITLWVPAYGWEALIKIITALASLVTTALLVRLLPQIAAIPSPAELQRANDALRLEAEERAKAEEMLRQAQKMEAIGRLAGGIAHDFNNLLAVIIGSIDRAQRKGFATADGKRAMSHALDGADRAAQLTRQLLAFTRQQPLQPRLHDLNEITRETADLLDKTIGPHIEICLELEPVLPNCVVDRPQLESALLNLGINSRDAMKDGGILTIRTNLTSPTTIEVSVTDTGCGMDAETCRRAIEPFFTTKEVGKGTGLGLSQVVGTVEQMGGSVELESAEGTGTTVRLFLPVKGSASGINDLSG